MIYYVNVITAERSWRYFLGNKQLVSNKGPRSYARLTYAKYIITRDLRGNRSQRRFSLTPLIFYKEKLMVRTIEFTSAATWPAFVHKIVLALFHAENTRHVLLCPLSAVSGATGCQSNICEFYNKTSNLNRCESLKIYENKETLILNKKINFSCG